MNRKSLFVILSFIGIGTVVGCKMKASADAVSDSTKLTAASATAMSPAEHGKYLVNLGGCNDCHTPWKPDGKGGAAPDMSRMLSGSPEGMVAPAPKLNMPWIVAASATMTAWSGPWGISYSKNLTPDSTGLGKWDEATFMLALKSGKHMGNGRPIMPPMPVEAIGKLNDDDLKAIFAYLKTIPAIKNTPPEYQPPVGAATASAEPKGK